MQHKPGVLVGNDAVPEFSAEAHPPGSAPASRTFQPQPTEEVPGQALNPDMQSGTKASDTIVGTTSGEVHQGYGHPGGGMTSQEEHGGARKKERSGLEGRGVSGSDPISDRGLDMEHEKVGSAGKPGRPEDWKGAEDHPSTSAEEVAQERR